MCARTVMFIGVRVITVVACMRMAILPALAQAGDSGGDSNGKRTRGQTAEARHLAGVAAFAKGRYREAIELFLEANRLRPRAAISFNIARCYEQMEDASSAITWYRDYLRRSDHPSDGRRIARRIAGLERRLAQRSAKQEIVESGPKERALNVELAPAPELGSKMSRPPRLEEGAAVVEVQPALGQRGRAILSAPQERGRGSALNTVGWIALGCGGGTLTGALAFELLRRAAEKRAQRETRQIEFARDVESMRSRQTVARVLVGVGATLSVAGGILLLLGANQSERTPETRVAFSCASRHCQASLTGAF